MVALAIKSRGDGPERRLPHFAQRRWELSRLNAGRVDHNEFGLDVFDGMVAKLLGVWVGADTRSERVLAFMSSSFPLAPPRFLDDDCLSKV
jgi:hypothetical protein